MKGMNVVALLIEHMFYCRHTTSPLSPEQRRRYREAYHSGRAVAARNIIFARRLL